MENYRESVQALIRSSMPDLDVDIDRITRWATAIVVLYLKSAVFPANDDGSPRLQHQYDAVVEAIAAQVLVVVENGLVEDVLSGGVGAVAPVTSSSDNGASVSFDYSESSRAKESLRSGELTVEARSILDAAGLGPRHPGIIF